MSDYNSAPFRLYFIAALRSLSFLLNRKKDFVEKHITEGILVKYYITSSLTTEDCYI